MKVRIERPVSDFPELIVTVPTHWPYVILEPFYDVHLGHSLHAAKQFERDVKRVASQRYTLTWNGGDLIENSVLGSPEVFGQADTPHEQFDIALDVLKPILPKMLFAIPGNHEARTWKVAGINLAKLIAERLNLHFFADYCFLTIRWRGNNFRAIIHHGTGASATAGAQRNAARKDMPWARADIYWTGHLHQPNVDPVFQMDFNQRSGRAYTRQGLAIISPSYLKYFGGYAAAKRLGPGKLGTIPVRLYPNGAMQVVITATGRRP